MRPGAGAALLGLDAAAIRDARLPVEALWGEAGWRLAAEVQAAEGARAQALLAALADRASQSPAPDPLVRAAIARLAAADVSALAAELAVSERQLRRRFAGAVGYGPKRLARVLRLGRALAAARADGELARAAFEAGYADQAHFTHECRALAGLPPSALLTA
jgi:AraC-like DNA-binding protein